VRWKSRRLFEARRSRKFGDFERETRSTRSYREPASTCPFSLPPFALLFLHRSLATCESPGFYLAREAKRTKRSRGLFSQAVNDGGVTGGRKRVDGCRGQRVSFSCAHCATHGRFQERGWRISLLCCSHAASTGCSDYAAPLHLLLESTKGGKNLRPARVPPNRLSEPPFDAEQSPRVNAKHPFSPLVFLLRDYESTFLHKHGG
jgi:hypothetical protein